MQKTEIQKQTEQVYDIFQKAFENIEIPLKYLNYGYSTAWNIPIEKMQEQMSQKVLWVKIELLSF